MRGRTARGRGRGLEAEADAPTDPALPRAVRQTVGDDRRHRASRRSDEALAQGWPLGPAVIEGALRASGNREQGAVGEALAHSRGAGGARPAGRMDPGAVASAPATATALSRTPPAPEPAESQLLEREA